MKTTLRLAFLLALPLGLAHGEEPIPDEGAFPRSTALAEGISPDALAALDELCTSLADEGEVVGSELLVIVGGKTILHEAYGLRDLEAGTPMSTGNVFCVRSMTKPVIGTAILILAGERKLSLDDPVADYLPELDVERWQGITLEHLITHTTGLPFSLIVGRDLSELEDIREVAALGATYDLAFEAGTAFEYSDQGSDTLTAVVEVVSGMSAEEFVRTRILEPLEMRDSTCLMVDDHPLRERALPKYVGTKGDWTRFWAPDQPSLFPFFLGSQGLYATLEDYAKFMDCWRRKGRAPSGRVIPARYVRKALVPTGLPFPGGSRLAGLDPGYGYQMQLWTQPVDDDPEEREVVVFGHGGSDGTHAWVFPEQKAMAFYFTQSRNTRTGLRVEEALGNLFLGTPFDPNVAAPPLEQYLGYYQEDEPDLYRAIVLDDGGLALEVRGKGVVALSYAGDDRWKFRDSPGNVIEFDRSAEGEITGFRLGGNQEYRFEPADDLPSVDELVERIEAAHRLDLIESLGPIRMTSSINIERVGLNGTVETVLGWPNLFRVDSAVGEESERVAFDGHEVRYGSHLKETAVLEGARAIAARTDNTFARFGDLRRWYPTLRVIEKQLKNGEEIFLVRTGDTSAPASTIYVHGESGRVLMVDSVVYVDTMGRIAQRQKFDDWREVHGMTLPHRTELQLPNPVIGEIVTTLNEVEVGVEAPEGWFRLED